MGILNKASRLCTGLHLEGLHNVQYLHFMDKQLTECMRFREGMFGKKTNIPTLYVKGKLPVANRFILLASRLEAIALRLEAIASRLEAIANRLEAIAM